MSSLLFLLLLLLYLPESNWYIRIILFSLHDCMWYKQTYTCWSSSWIQRRCVNMHIKINKFNISGAFVCNKPLWIDDSMLHFRQRVCVCATKWIISAVSTWLKRSTSWKLIIQFDYHKRQKRVPAQHIIISGRCWQLQKKMSLF